MEPKNQITRRKFLKDAVLYSVIASGLPSIVPSSVFGRQGRVSPSDKIVVGSIGLGMQGMPNTQGFLDEPDTKVVAVCDPDENHLREAKQMIDGYYKNRD